LFVGRRRRGEIKVIWDDQLIGERGWWGSVQGDSYLNFNFGGY